MRIEIRNGGAVVASSECGVDLRKVEKEEFERLVWRVARNLHMRDLDGSPIMPETHEIGYDSDVVWISKRKRYDK